MTKEVSNQINSIMGKITGDLKELAGKYGAWIVVFFVVVYVWRKIR